MDRSKHGTIFDIQRYSLHDGPGLRILVFFKGCPLTCLWCSNPESQSLDTEMMFELQLCEKDCTVCIGVCPTNALEKSPNEKSLLFENSKCNVCGKCVEACPVNAARFVGRQVGEHEVLFEIERDLPFFRRSGGGITLGGGEPTSQPEFAYHILRACQEQGIHTAIETCGHTSWEILKTISDVTDLFLFDIKQMDSNKHVRLTGKDNALILDNLCRLSRIHSNVVVRYPLIPGHNDNDNEILSLVHFVKELKNINRIELCPYHCLGQSKYKMLFRDYPLKDLRLCDRGHVESVLETIRSNGIECELLH